MGSFSNDSAYNRQTLQSEKDDKVVNEHPSPKYPHYFPVWDPTQICPPLEPFDHKERARDADPGLSNLRQSCAETLNLTPRAGSELCNVQLSHLTGKARDEFALFVAQRKVVVLRGQDMRDLSIPKVVSFCRYFGSPSVHPVGPSVPGYPEIHIAHSGGGDTRVSEAAGGRTTTMAWHIDGSVERQPPGLVFLYMLECPDTGGDTVFTDTVAAYEKLSPGFRQRLHGLQAEHTDVALVEGTRKSGGIAKRDGVSNVHPIVRTHPATGQKALFVNPICECPLEAPCFPSLTVQDTTRVVGYKKEESDALLKFLFDHVALSQDCQVRVRWSEGAVVVFDVRVRLTIANVALTYPKNRIVSHSAIYDFLDEKRRHLARISLAAERPYETPFEG